MILIRELGNAPVPHTPFEKAENYYACYFTVGKVPFKFRADFYDALYDFKNVWDIEFKDMSRDTFTITGTGNTPIVFSTVKEILKDFLSIEKPNYWLMMADKDEKSRDKLYSIFAKNIEKIFPEYKLAKESVGMFHYFMFERK